MWIHCVNHDFKSIALSKRISEFRTKLVSTFFWPLMHNACSHCPNARTSPNFPRSIFQILAKSIPSTSMGWNPIDTSTLRHHDASPCKFWFRGYNMERQLQFGNDKQSVLIYYSTFNLYTKNKLNIILITDTSISSIEQSLHRIEGKFQA